MILLLTVSQMIFTMIFASNSIPDDLYNDLAWIITNKDADIGSCGRVLLPDKQYHRVLNIA